MRINKKWWSWGVFSCRSWVQAEGWCSGFAPCWSCCADCYVDSRRYWMSPWTWRSWGRTVPPSDSSSTGASRWLCAAPGCRMSKWAGSWPSLTQPWRWPIRDWRVCCNYESSRRSPPTGGRTKDPNTPWRLQRWRWRPSGGAVNACCCVQIWSQCYCGHGSRWRNRERRLWAGLWRRWPGRTICSSWSRAAAAWSNFLDRKRSSSPSVEGIRLWVLLSSRAAP